MSDISETFPMDFLGAAWSEAETLIIYLSTDDDAHMDSVSVGSVDDVI